MLAEAKIYEVKYTWMVAVFLSSPPTGEKVESSPFSIVNSTVPLPVSLQKMVKIVFFFLVHFLISNPKTYNKCITFETLHL